MQEGSVQEMEDLKRRRPEFFCDRVITTEKDIKKTCPDFDEPSSDSSNALTNSQLKRDRLLIRKHHSKFSISGFLVKI